MKRHGYVLPMWEQENDRDDRHALALGYEDPVCPI